MWPGLLSGSPNVGGAGPLTLGTTLEDTLAVPCTAFIQAVIFDPDAFQGLVRSEALEIEFR